MPKQNITSEFQSKKWSQRTASGCSFISCHFSFIDITSLLDSKRKYLPELPLSSSADTIARLYPSGPHPYMYISKKQLSGNAKLKDDFQSVLRTLNAFLVFFFM